MMGFSATEVYRASAVFDIADDAVDHRQVGLASDVPVSFQPCLLYTGRSQDNYRRGVTGHGHRTKFLVVCSMVP
jgi:hypothetical protein